jgi:NAD(P)-dependent dehydrogenase (short-subunit alcohol dehydrogenase family)
LLEELSSVCSRNKHERKMTVSISDKIVVITGAGSGLGRALAIGLAQRGATVIGLGSRDSSLSETESLVESKRFSWHVVDVSKAAVVKSAMQQIILQFGRIDVLINSAAVYPKISFLEQDADNWMHTIAVNLGGVANCCREVLPLMMRQGSGRIINIGSFADLAPIPNSSAYAASKGGMRALTKAIGADLGAAFPDVICAELIPGPMSTQMNNFTGKDPVVCVEWVEKIIKLPPGRSKSIIFEGAHEVIPRQRLMLRLKQKIMFWRR